MINSPNIAIFNNKIDFLFIKFPIIFPLIYFMILILYPQFENYLIFMTLLILAEPHFGATWPFFISQANSNLLKKEKDIYIFIPIFLIFISILLFFYFDNLFYLLFFIFNIYHVTRQSAGVSKLYIKKKLKNLSFVNAAIYFFGIWFFLIGIVRFYFDSFGYELDSMIIFISLFLLTLCLTLYGYFFKDSSNIFILMTGILMFFPIAFVSKPIHGIIMGVTMHYTQYIALTYKVVTKRKEDNFFKKFVNYNYVSVIIIYGLIMSVLSFTNQLNNNILGHLIIIPILGQLLHFYLDGLLWKFDKSHNREATLKHLFD